MEDCTSGCWYKWLGTPEIQIGTFQTGAGGTGYFFFQQNLTPPFLNQQILPRLLLARLDSDISAEQRRRHYLFLGYIVLFHWFYKISPAALSLLNEVFNSIYYIPMYFYFFFYSFILSAIFSHSSISLQGFSCCSLIPFCLTWKSGKFFPTLSMNKNYSRYLFKSFRKILEQI